MYLKRLYTLDHVYSFPYTATHMAKIDTDPKKIKELLSRGVDEVIDLKDLEKKLKSGKQLRVKLGIDPTSPNLHIGRSVPLLKLRDFQELGHQVILIFGTATGVIGDTSDKDAERPMLEQEIIDRNVKEYKKQAAKILDIKKTEVVLNHTWLNKLSYREIGEQADLFSVNQFIQRDNIRRRLDAGKRVSLREVLYPLMQGYDSVAVQADVELGGTDQRFNLLAGRDMQPHFGQEPQNIIMNPLVEGLDGRKMSSSWGNTVNFMDEPADMYGKIMSMQDEYIVKYFTYFTRVPMSRVGNIHLGLDKGEHPKIMKQELAREIVTMYHDEKAAEAAESAWKEAFEQGGIPADTKTVEVKVKVPLVDLLIKQGMVKSKTEFRRLVEAGAIKAYGKLEERKIVDPNSMLNEDCALKIGKKRFLKIKIVKKK